MQQQSFFFYDYETTGIDPKRDRILQFAGIRTDTDFNIISDPIAIYSKISKDIIPNPEALLITGITPDILENKGVSEINFLKIIYQEFAKPHTCVVGFNNIRFDDEFTRYAFYRNFYDPYSREWQNNNSRLDLIDIVRMCAALRPDGINWPENKSFKLTELTKANNLDHYKAHDALSDVYATIELAKLIKNAQPKLFNYLLQMRKKDFVEKTINLSQPKLLVHSTRMVSSEFYATSIFLPLLRDPYNPNAIIMWDLRYSPDILLNLTTDIKANQKLLYTPKDELEDIDQRLNLKTVFINKVPAIAPFNTIDNQGYNRLQLNADIVETRKDQILNNKDKWYNILLDLYSVKPDFISHDVEHQLYDGFIANEDRYLCNRVLLTNENKLIDLQNKFSDNRLIELLFRYRARNYLNTLSSDELAKWDEYCKSRLDNQNQIASISKQEFIAKCQNIKNNSDIPMDQKATLEKWLEIYAD